ncbi:MAG: ribonuclease P protein component [Ferruginibacter sp.]
MQTSTRYFYRRANKLKSRKTIERLFKEGKNFSNFPFRVYWLPGDPGSILQAGVGVPARHFKKAVERNRIKRLMREAWRLQKNPLEQMLAQQEKSLCVFILYSGTDLPGYDTIFEKTTHVLNRLIKLAGENN